MQQLQKWDSTGSNRMKNILGDHLLLTTDFIFYGVLLFLAFYNNTYSKHIKLLTVLTVGSCTYAWQMCVIVWLKYSVSFHLITIAYPFNTGCCVIIPMGFGCDVVFVVNKCAVLKVLPSDSQSVRLIRVSAYRQGARDQPRSHREAGIHQAVLSYQL